MGQDDESGNEVAVLGATPMGSTTASGRQRAWFAYLPWGALALAVAGFGVFYLVEYQSVVVKRDSALHEVSEGDVALIQATQSLDQTRKALSELRAKRDELARQLAQTERKRAEAEAALKRLQNELGAALESDIASGEVLVRTRDGRVVVDVSDKLLFETGEVEVSESGQKVLLQVATTLRRLPDVTFQVAGHTDSARVVSPELKERYPTNWELSTARATNVVRFLQERGKVPGRRLVAAGHAEFQPAASNRSKQDRAKNRRIEITLLPSL